MSSRRAFLRTTTFRLTLFAAALFALFAFLILAYVYTTTAGALSRQNARAIESEAAELVRSYNAFGVDGLNRLVLQRSIGASANLYLLVEPDGARISGNLSTLPDEAPGEGLFSFTYAQPDPEGGDELERRRAQGRLIVLPAGYQLLVGMDVEDSARIINRVTDAILTGSLGVLAFGVLLGAVVSRRFAERINAVNQVARDVAAGDLRRRAPRNFSGDELDEMSENLNAMLDRIERLTAGLRHAGDSIAHDLRSPLTRMRTSLEAGLRAVEKGESGEEPLQQALSDTEDLLNTFNAVLRIARLEAGERREMLSPLDPAEIVADLGELYEAAAEDAGLEFTVEAPPGLTVLGDRGLISQALANLLDNAIKYSPPGGFVALRLRRTSTGEREISVTDSGPGIPEESRERVLERFVRLESSRSMPGAGLGLSLVKAVAEIHKGRVDLSEGPGGPGGPGLCAALVLPEPK